MKDFSLENVHQVSHFYTPYDDNGYLLSDALGA